MLFIDFLGKESIKGSNTRLSLLNTVGSSMEGTGASPFNEFNMEYVKEENKVVLEDIYAGESDNGFSGKVFQCDNDYADKIAKGKRSAEDNILILTDKVRFIDGAKAYFSLIPFEDTMLIALHAGVIEVMVGNEWIPFVRTKAGFNMNSERFVYTVMDLCPLVSAVDKDTKYNKVHDGVSLVEMLITVGKDGTKGVSCKGKADYFYLLNESNLEKAKARKAIEDEKKAEKDAKKAAERAENERIQRRFLEQKEAEEKKAKEARDKKRREKAEKKAKDKEDEDAGFRNFTDILSSLGFKR